MGAFRIFSRLAELLDIAVTRAAPAWLRLNADGTVSERTASQTLGDIGGVSTGRTVAGHPLSSNVTLVSADISDASQTWLAGSLPVYGWGGITVATDYTSLDGYYAPQAIQNGKPSFGDGEFTDVGAWRSLGYSGGVWTIISYLDGTQLGYFTGEGEWPSEVVTWSPESGAIGSVVTSVTAVDRRLAGFTLPAGVGTLALTSDLSGYLTTSTAASTYVPTSRTIAGRDLSSDITLGSADISDASTGGNGTADAGKAVLFDANGGVTLGNSAASGKVTVKSGLYASTLTAGYLATNRTATLPDASGTLALTASATGIPDALHNSTISGTVTFSGSETRISMFYALGTGTPSSTTYLRGDGTWARVLATTTTDATTARTLALADIGNYIRCTHASGCVITIPQQTTVAWPDGSIIYIRRATGAGAITLAGSGITYNDSGVAGITAGQSFALRKAATDSWDFI